MPDAAGRRGRLFVLSGPSGVGKSTVLTLLRRDMNGVHYSVSATTRFPRPGERNGVHYFFVSAEEFNRKVESSTLR